VSKPVMIRRQDGTEVGNVDEHTSLAHMRAECPAFFRWHMGKRETYHAHRGQIVACYSVPAKGGMGGNRGVSRRRKRVPYLYFRDGHMPDDTFCLAPGGVASMAEARRTIDRALDEGRLP